MEIKDYMKMTEFILFDNDAYLLSREIMDKYSPEIEIAMMIMFTLGVSVGRRQGGKMIKYDKA